MFLMAHDQFFHMNCLKQFGCLCGTVVLSTMVTNDCTVIARWKELFGIERYGNSCVTMSRQV